MTDSEVWDAFVEWANGISPTLVIQSYQEADRPAVPYIMVNMPVVQDVHDFMSSVSYDVSDTEANDQGKPLITMRPKVEVEWHFSVHAFGPGPTDLLRPMRARAKSIQSMEPMYPDIVIHDVSEIRYIPDMIQSEWEPRAQMDVYVRGYIEDGFIVETIDQTSFDFNRE